MYFTKTLRILLHVFCWYDGVPAIFKKTRFANIGLHNEDRLPQTRQFYRKIKLWRIKFRYMYQHVQLNGDKSPLIFKRKNPYLVHVSLIPCIGSTVWTACRSTFPRTTPISEDDRTVCPSLALFLQSPTTDVLPVMHCRLFHYIMKQLLEISYAYYLLMS